jgi:hypothetical protein
MAFVVENGTGSPDANSYVSTAEADSFHADRGNASWTGSDTVKQAALIKATDYLEQTYGMRWMGVPLNDVQALGWPRTTQDGIPRALKQAACILALEAITGTELNPTQGRAIKRDKTDVLETEYMDNAAPGDQRPAIDGLLAGAGLITGSGRYGMPSNGRVVRV